MRAAVTLRPARAGDAEAVCLIYNQGIEDRVATLETDLRAPPERREWLAARGPRHPVIVAESGGVVVGWGSLNPFSAREAYRHAADFSVYVEREWRGKGVGHRLLERNSKGNKWTGWFRPDRMVELGISSKPNPIIPQKERWCLAFQ